LSNIEKSSVTSYKCSMFGKTFASLGDMRNHTMTEHLQKGDFPSEEK